MPSEAIGTNHLGAESIFRIMLFSIALSGQRRPRWANGRPSPPARDKSQDGGSRTVPLRKETS